MVMALDLRVLPSSLTAVGTQKSRAQALSTILLPDSLLSLSPPLSLPSSLSLLKRQAAQSLPHTPPPHIRKGKEDAIKLSSGSLRTLG